MIGSDPSLPAARDAHDVLIRFRWPGVGPGGECDNFFFGVWHPHRTIRVELVGTPAGMCTHRRGRNWLLASAVSPLHPPGTGLLHAAPEGSLAVGFRGYILPRLHSYSSSADILAYWARQRCAEHNGVFSAVVIDEHSMTLVTDVLGMGPVYYRSLGGAVVFATNPRYVTADDAAPDLVAWRSLLQTSWIVGDRALCQGVKRLPAGHVLRASREGLKVVRWFDFDKLPSGTKAVGQGAVAEVEEALDRAVSRCLELEAGGVVLPLSSGFDSRRMLALMMKKQVDFRAITYRGYQKSHRDLDAQFATQMARDFGFPHVTVEAKSREEYVSDDVVRRILVHAEALDHSWAVRVMKALPSRPGLFFDGIAGDILGDPVGWNVHVGLEVEARSGSAEVDAIASHSVKDTFDSVLREGVWPSAEEVRRTIREYVASFLPRSNLGELAFLLLRQRRAISPWSQQLLPAGHVAVCPYLDLDYLRLLLGFRSVDKHEVKFQRACLREFWPELYRYPGNRDIPDDLPPGSPELANVRAVSCYAPLREEVRASDRARELRELLSVKGRLALRMSDVSRTVQLRSRWYLHPLLELVSRQSVEPCWKWGAA